MTMLMNVSGSEGNRTVCVNSFAPMDLTNLGLDFILGDSFMRNVYTLLNFGNWTNNSTDLPYAQLLSVRDCADNVRDAR